MKTISLQEKYNRDRFEMLLEVIDENEMRQLGQTFSEINKILGSANLPSVKRIVQQAGQDIAGLQSQGFFKQLLGAVTLNVGQKRVMSSVVSLQTQLISMLRALPDMMNIAGPAIEKVMKQDSRDNSGLAAIKNQTLASALFDSGPAGRSALTNLKKLMSKALQPDAISGLFSKYEINPEAVTKEILDLPMEDLRGLAQRAAGTRLQVPIEKEDIQQLQGAEQKTDAAAAMNQLTPDQAESYLHVLSFLEKVGQEINPNIKKALASRLRAGRDAEVKDTGS